jgi:hypothetical protein
MEERPKDLRVIGWSGWAPAVETADPLLRAAAPAGSVPAMRFAQDARPWTPQNLLSSCGRVQCGPSLRPEVGHEGSHPASTAIRATPDEAAPAGRATGRWCGRNRPPGSTSSRGVGHFWTRHAFPAWHLSGGGNTEGPARQPSCRSRAAAETPPAKRGCTCEASGSTSYRKPAPERPRPASRLRPASPRARLAPAPAGRRFPAPAFRCRAS